MSLITQRISSLNNLPRLSDVSNRINFLTLKNKAVNKKIITYVVNSIERSKLSENNQKNNSEQKHDLQSFVSLKQMAKLIKERDKPTKQEETNQKHRSDRNSQQSLNNQQLKNNRIRKKTQLSNQKNQIDLSSTRACIDKTYIDKRYIDKIYTGSYRFKDGKRLRKDKKLLTIQHENTSTKDGMQPKDQTSSKDNYIKPNNGVIFEQFAFKPIGKDSHKAMKIQATKIQAMKLVQLKKKLLEEEQKTLQQYEECVLYKQKIVQKLKYQRGLCINPQLKPRKDSQVVITGFQQDEG